MNEALYLHNELSAIRNRLRLVRARRWAVRGGLAAGAVSLALLLASRLLPEWDAPDALLALAWTLGLLGGAAWGFARPVELLQAARWTEDRLDLKERLSTAVELSRREEDPTGRAVLSDAARQLRDAPATGLYPRALDRPVQILALLTALSAVLDFVPDLSVLRSPERRAEVATMKKEGTELEKKAERLEKRAEEKRLPVEKQIAANMKALGKDLRRGKMTQKQALLRLNKLTDEIQKRQNLLAAGTATAGAGKNAAGAESSTSETALEKLAPKSASAQSGDTPTTGMDADSALSPELSDALMKFADGIKVGKSDGLKLTQDLISRFAQSMAVKDYKGAAGILDKLAEKLRGGGLSESEKKELGQQLEALAGLLKQSDLKGLAARLMEGAKALKDADPEAAANLLDQASQSLQQMDLLASLQAAAGQ